MNFSYAKLYKILRNNLLAILAGGILFFGIAFAYSKFMIDPVYYADTAIMIRSNKHSDSPSTQEITAARQLVSTYITILDTDMYSEFVYEQMDPALKSKISPSYIYSGISLSIKGETEVIHVRYSCMDQDLARVVLSDIVKNISSYAPLVSSFDVSVNQTEKISNVRVSSSKITTYSTLGFILGASLMYGFAFLREALDIRIKSSKDLSERFEYPVIGAIPYFKSGQGKTASKD